jgi:hypothetical protein
MAKGAAKKGKGTGTPNKKPIGASARKYANTLNPWGGPNIPKGAVPKSVGNPSGSSMRKPTPDPQLRGMDYPANDPLLWPVEIDKVNHTRQPSSSGISSTVINKNNTAVEQAYTRAKYQ